MDELETEARSRALNYVSSILKEPHHLDRLDAHKKRTARKKAAVEAMLKSAVQSQLEGVREGLNQLKAAAQDITTIEENLSEIDTLLTSYAPLRKELEKLREESRKHSQYAAAMENLKQIFNVPETIERTYQLIQDAKLLNAHKNLMELETARDDLMYEVHKLHTQSDYDKNLLKNYFSEVEKLAGELGKQIWYILGRVLEAVRGADPGPQQVVTALRVIEREERMDAQCIERHRVSGFMPVGRPRNWREKCFEILQKNVRNRIEGNQLSDRNLDKDWLAKYLEMCRKMIVDDLRTVKGGCVPCFPPDYEVYDTYVKLYHTCLAEKLREIASERLEKNETLQILSWLRTYSSEEMLKQASLQIEVDRLLADQPLLPKTTVGQLVDNFLDVTRTDVHSWLEKTLQTEKDDWYADGIPEADQEKYYYTQMPQIVFQIVTDQLALGKEINVDNIIAKTLDVCVDELIIFTNKYRDSFFAYKNKHFEDRGRFTQFTKIIIAVANNCTTCIDETDRLKRTVRVNMETDVTSPRGSITKQELIDKFTQVRERWNTNQLLAVQFLSEEVFTDLSPHLSQILTKKWLNQETPNVIGETVVDYYTDHRHLKAHTLSTLLMQLQYRILGEYIRAIEQKRMTFYSYEERKKAAELMEDEANDLKRKFTDLVPSDKEEGISKFELLTDILPAIADFLSLRDKSLLALEVSSFIRKYPDISVEQLTALINMREDYGRSESKQLAEEIVEQNKFRPKQPTAMSVLFQPMRSTAEDAAIGGRKMATAQATLVSLAMGAGEAAVKFTNKPNAQNE